MISRRLVKVARPAKPLLCFPDPLPSEWARPLRDAGYDLVFVSGTGAVAALERAGKDSWTGAVICATENMTEAVALCRHLRRREEPVSPLLLIVARHEVAELKLRNDLFDDFCVAPLHPGELAARVDHVFWRTGQPADEAMVEHGPLVLNLETYQAGVAGRALDLTYMEYQLLRFLATHPGKVFTRETLLNQVWGYEYYGGARTVDVHVRRLRAKLGEEHAHLIQTVRSVGYRLGQTGWTPSGQRQADDEEDEQPPGRSRGAEERFAAEV
jgi:two-component system, OmpR family, alkaline phosphatase synthesis response regulator PhoP